MSHLFLEFNNIDQRWKVVRKSGYTPIGDGSTIDEAIGSARMITDEPIYLDDEVIE